MADSDCNTALFAQPQSQNQCTDDNVTNVVALSSATNVTWEFRGPITTASATAPVSANASFSTVSFDIQKSGESYEMEHGCMTSSNCNVPLDLSVPRLKSIEDPQQLSTDRTTNFTASEPEEQMLQQQQALLGWYDTSHRRHSDSIIQVTDLSRCVRYQTNSLQLQRSSSSASERDSLEELRHIQTLTLRQQTGSGSGAISDSGLLSSKRMKLKNYLLRKYQFSLQHSAENTSVEGTSSSDNQSPHTKIGDGVPPLFAIPTLFEPDSRSGRFYKARSRSASLFSLRRRYRESIHMSSSSTSEGESDTSSAVTSPSVTGTSTSTFTTPSNSPLREKSGSFYFQFPQSPLAGKAGAQDATAARLHHHSAHQSAAPEKNENSARRALRAHLKRKMINSRANVSNNSSSLSTEADEFGSSKTLSLFSELSLMQRYHVERAFSISDDASFIHSNSSSRAAQTQLLLGVHGSHQHLSDSAISSGSSESLTSTAFYCPVCGERFDSLALFAQHVATESTKRHHSHQLQQQQQQHSQAVDCDQQQPQQQSLQPQQQLEPQQPTPAQVDNRLPVMCTLCGRAFSRSDMLSRHMRLHTGLRPYSCQICGQTFSRSDHLSTHARSHTGEKPYKCTQCSYAAPRRDMITRHQKIHAGGGSGSVRGAYKQRRQRAVAFWHVKKTLLDDQQDQSSDGRSQGEAETVNISRRQKSVSSTDSSENENVGLQQATASIESNQTVATRPGPEEEPNFIWPFWSAATASELDRLQASALIDNRVTFGDDRNADIDDPRKPCWLLPTLAESQSRDHSPLTRSPSTLSVTSNNADEVSAATASSGSTNANKCHEEPVLEDGDALDTTMQLTFQKCCSTNDDLER